MRSEGFSFYFGGMGVETCSLDSGFVFATIGIRQKHDGGGDPMAVPMGRAAKVVSFGGLKRRELRFLWQAWRFVTLFLDLTMWLYLAAYRTHGVLIFSQFHPSHLGYDAV